MNADEIKIKDKTTIPYKLFHLVPKDLFLRYSDSGNYDCRKKQEWGRNSDFVHTTTTRQDLKEKVADINWKNYPKETEFILLIIDTNKIKSDFTYVIYNGTVYYHIWGSLPKNSFEISDITRNGDGTFNL